MKVKNCRPDYTGGGVFIFTGQLEDGNYFLADCTYHSTLYSLRVVNENPENLDESLEVEWQEKHFIKDVSRCKGFMRDMFKWIIKNKPYGNYLIDDIEQMLKYL